MVLYETLAVDSKPLFSCLCFIWCPVHYCQHIWKVLSLETSPILFQAGLNISRQEAENETFPQETACGAFYSVQQTEGLILCKKHLNKQLYIYPPHLWNFSLFFMSVVVWKNRRGKMWNSRQLGLWSLFCSVLFFTICACNISYQHPHQGQWVFTDPQHKVFNYHQHKRIPGKVELPLSCTHSTAAADWKQEANQIDSSIAFLKSDPGLVRLVYALVHDFINVEQSRPWTIVW